MNSRFIKPLSAAYLMVTCNKCNDGYELLCVHFSRCSVQQHLIRIIYQNFHHWVISIDTKSEAEFQGEIELLLSIM